jgi:hypothetical protein
MRLRNDLYTYRRIEKDLTHSRLQTVKLGKPRMFHENGRTDVRKSQYMQGRGSGKSERQQSESSEESTEMYITRWI